MNTDVEDLLREGMERFTADLSAPAGLTRRATRRRRGRLVRRSATGVVAALASGAVALAVIALPGAGDDHARAVEAAYVVKRVTSALNVAEPGDIAQMTVTTRSVATPGGKAVTTTADEWSRDGQWRSVTYSAAGKPVYDDGFTASSGFTVVSYPARTWARQAVHGRALPRAAFPQHCVPALIAFPVLFKFGLPGIGLPASALPATVGTSLRTAVSCGALTVAGREEIDGMETIKLTSGAGSLITETIWVSPGTYLPVHAVVHSGSGMLSVQQTANITWLPPTAQNLAKLTVPIPAGFRRVSLADAATPALRKIPGGLLPRPTPCLAVAAPACKQGAKLPPRFHGMPPKPRLAP